MEKGDQVLKKVLEKVSTGLVGPRLLDLIKKGNWVYLLIGWEFIGIGWLVFSYLTQGLENLS